MTSVMPHPAVTEPASAAVVGLQRLKADRSRGPHRHGWSRAL